MFLRHLGRQLLMALALGLIILPAASWATTVTIPHPFDSTITYTGPGGQLPSLSLGNALQLGNNAPGGTTPNADYQAYNTAVSGNAPNTTFFATLDLQNNDVILFPTVNDSAHGQALYKAVSDMARSGSDGGVQDGTGVMSSFAKTDAAHGNSALGVGVLYNDDGSGGQFYGGANADVNATFDGYSTSTQFGPLTPFDTMVKYTFLGDTFLRGFIDTFDTSQTQNNSDLGVIPTLNYWQQGDFYYQATSGSPINTFDTSAVFNDQVLQSNYPLTVHFGEAGDAALSVPEPASALLAVLGVLGTAIAAAVARRRNRVL